MTNESRHRYECALDFDPKDLEVPPHFRWIAEKEIQFGISESILQEYLEIIGRKTTGQIAQNLGELDDKFTVISSQKVRIREQKNDALGLTMRLCPAFAFAQAVTYAHVSTNA